MEKKKVIDIKKLLNGYIRSKKKIRIERHFSNNEIINGFIHDMSENLLIIEQFHDFYCEGYSIIRLSDLSDFRSDQHERFFEKMLLNEGLLDQVGYKKNVPITNLKISLTYFAEKNENIIIESESSDNPEDDEFYIGKISEIKEEDVWFIGFNALGEWDEEEVAIKIADITRIQFDTPYINVFSKYIQ
jgi:hypothetical protein